MLIKLAYANKTKEPITSHKLGPDKFWRIANSALEKGKSAIPLLFNRPEVLSSTADKANLSVKLAKKVITNLDFYKASSPDCISVVVPKLEPELYIY